MRATSAPPSRRASSGPGRGFPIESPMERVSSAIGTFAPRGRALLEAFDETFETRGGVLDPPRGVFGARRRGFGTLGGALRARGRVVAAGAHASREENHDSDG